MKKAAFYLILIILVISFSACEEHEFDSVNESPGLKKGSKQTSDVQFGDLYGDLVEVEINDSGVPVLYPLHYFVEYQDAPIEGIIDVQNPRLSGSFDLEVYVRDNGIPEFENGVPKMDTILIDPGDDGFWDDPVVLYDLEGEILEEVTYHVIPVEQGRLNLIRSSPDVLPRRMTEVIKNFGDGTVAAVVRDYCGRFYMVRTDAALALGYQDKPIDSPLENMAIYKELMLYGFDRPAEDNGLQFLVDSFDFHAKVDKVWSSPPMNFPPPPDRSIETTRSMVMNLAAACIAAASDKSGSLKLDEIILVNRFLGIPSGPFSFFPTVTQPVRMLNKTNKTVDVKYRYFIDYSDDIDDSQDDYSYYTRDKFEETMIEFYIINNEYVKVVADTFKLHDILSYEADYKSYYTDVDRYKEKGVFKNAVGFANQADDYVQALAVIHNNEEFFVWQMPTPTWSVEGSPVSRESSPFNYLPEEDHEGGSGGGGNPGGGGGNGNGGKK